MKRKQSPVIKFTVMETTVSSEIYVEFMPQSWIIPPKNKHHTHRERDAVKFLFPRRLPQQTKDHYMKYIKQAKFNCITPEHNEKWELRDGRILRMGLASLEEALQAEKFYSDYFTTTEAEDQDDIPPPPKKVVLKKKKSDVKPITESGSEEEDQGDAIPNYNVAFQSNDQLLDMFTLDDENSILNVNLNQFITGADGVFETENANLSQPIQIQLDDTFPSNETFMTIGMPTIGQPSNELADEIFDEVQQMETADDTAVQQSNCPQTSCCKYYQKVLNKIDYVQKKLSKELSSLRQESRANRQLLLKVVSLLSPSEVQAEDIRMDQIQEPPGEPAHPQIDMAELDKFNAKYKEIFPILSSDFIVEFNKSLKDDQTFADYLLAKLSKINGSDETKTVRKILKELCHVRCLKDFTWLGTKKMKCFMDLHLIVEMTSKLLEAKYPGCEAIDIIAKVVKQRTKSAKEAYVRLLEEEAAAAAKLASVALQNAIPTASTEVDASMNDTGSSILDDNQVAGPSAVHSKIVECSSQHLGESE